MTEKPDDNQNNDNDNQSADIDKPKNSVNTEDLDIAGALAAVASLQDLTREQETDEFDDDSDDVVEIQEFERVDEPMSIEPDNNELHEEIDPALNHDDEPLEIVPEPSAVYETSFPSPPMSVLHRGQLASVIPALLLIGIGSYLTFIFTTTEVTFQPLLIIGLLFIGLGGIFLAQWLSSARWTIGSFFFGLAFLLTGLTSTYLTLPTNLTWVDGYPLLITAIGTAFVVTDIVVPSGRRVWLIGLILAITGLVGVLATTLLTEIAIPSSNILLPIGIGVGLILLIAPLLSRRQQ